VAVMKDDLSDSGGDLLIKPESDGLSSGAGARKGNLIVLTGPSGVGKGTLVDRLLTVVLDLVKSVSVTTRQKRPQETEAVDYFFASRQEFEGLKAELLEWAEFAGNCYGTPADWVNEQLAHGKDVLLEIEVLGARQVFEARPDSLLIFVSPPSFEALRQRLEKRGTEAPEKIERRLAKAREELTQKVYFHYEVINDDIDEAVNNLTHIVYAERCRIRK
jgi:guanylate kinase